MQGQQHASGKPHLRPYYSQHDLQLQQFYSFWSPAYSNAIGFNQNNISISGPLHLESGYMDSPPTPSTPTKAYVCSTCNKQYQRNTHLRRHEATHTNAHRFKCEFCGKEFSRGDVCRKHSLNCPKNGNASLPQEHRRGRKPTACEACFQSKVLCDRKQPCSRCVQRKVPCRARDLTDVQSNSAQSGSEAEASMNMKSGDTPGMKFLRGILDPSRRTMLEYLNTTDNDQVLNEDIPEVKAGNSNKLPIQDPFIPDMMDIMSLFPTDYASMLDDMMQDFVPDDDLNFLSLSSASPVPFLTDAGYSLLEAKSASMAMDLYTIHCTLASTDAAYNDAFDPQQAESVLCVDNLRSFIATFFRLSHLHFPIVHYPTFGTVDTSKCLLLTVIMCGVYRSPSMPDTAACQSYLRLAEEYVFREIEFAMGTSPPGPPTPENLQILQSGIMMLYLLFLTNDRSARKRGQIQRLPRLVAAVRHFGLNKMRRTPGVEWYKFIYEETCLRVAFWTAIGDSHHSFMFNCPPAVSMREMTCSLPCHRELWDAPDMAAFIVRREGLTPTNGLQSLQLTHSLQSFIMCLFDDNWSLVEDLHPDVVSIESLFSLSNCISGIAVSNHHTATLQFTAPGILRTITRWQQIWNLITSKMDPKDLLKVGMARHSCETMEMIKVFIDASLKGSNHPFLASCGHGSLETLYDFLMQAMGQQRTK